jgi:uncharacterized membrane protein
VIKDPAARTRLKDVSARRPDDNRFGLLLGVLVSAYVISAFLSGYWVRVLQTTLFLLVALIAVWTSRLSGWNRRLATGIVLAGSGIAVFLTRIAPEGPAGGAAFAWIALMLLLAVVIIVGRVLAKGEVTLQSIFGAISAYMIIGLMFAACYAAMSGFSSTAFFAGGQPGDFATFQYFSFTTLTTVGYGDFTAAAASGRAIAVMEALLGQVFLATLVARLMAAFRGPRLAGPDVSLATGDEDDVTVGNDAGDQHRITADPAGCSTNGEHMATLTAWRFTTPEGADAALQSLQRLEAQQLIDVQDAAVVSWEPGRKKPKTRDIHSTTRGGAMGGGLWGLLFGLIFFVPILGLAIGAATGALVGSLADVGISDSFIKQVRERVTPGTSALFLLTSNAVFDRVQAEFGQMDAELISTNLSAEQEARLREAFATED